jgi:hypothetical protein
VGNGLAYRIELLKAQPNIQLEHAEDVLIGIVETVLVKRVRHHVTLGPQMWLTKPDWGRLRFRLGVQDFGRTC